MFLTIFISNIIAWVVLEAIFSFPPCSWVFLFIQDLHFKIHVQSKQGEMGFFFTLFLPHVAVGIPANLHGVPPFLTRIFWAHTIVAGKCTLGCTLPHSMWDSPPWQ